MARMSLSPAEEMKQSFLGFAALVVLVLVALVALIKYPWEWLVPVLFPGAVRQGLIVGTISWEKASVMAIVITIMAGILRAICFPWERSSRRHLDEFRMEVITRQLGIDFDAALNAELTSMVKNGLKSEAMALYREHTGAGLADAQDRIEELVRAVPATSEQQQPG